jgi:hypothetical protein
MPKIGRGQRPKERKERRKKTTSLYHVQISLLKKAVAPSTAMWLSINSPRHGLLALRRWWDALAFENVAYCLSLTVYPRLYSAPQSDLNPRAILSSLTHHQGLQLLVNAGTSKALVL